MQKETTPAPLIDRLTAELKYPVLDLTNIDEFLENNEFSVLFFTEDIKRFPETNDVAVVLPELLSVFPDLSPAIIARNDEKKIQSLYGFRAWPALVFMRRDQYLDAITGIQDWGDYLTQIKSILTSEPKRPLSIGVPVVSS
ncbi:hydrogenase-1 expression HyaE [Cocleimonas sp. KMM 6892]|uniref:hydrogenase-1 expression HyaE n=1 Tax=unclassified Cocleimonas TaxID=2639732 RepID=UPI002DBDE9B2|nr:MULTISPECIES: hydrogenase-1 expression HyaE [unclassified Cocleimonas]MEB8430687.1 hydrogenase-1 expression HyaE [Cocleimonas sp. KMM 6892]MEC4714541.1 hydrogenase-1 expression HyaE [Cocleimonas sp. KMM 6895]MEC4743874.1 hydrogenase-1 expression HyaE [Cocleimonas sp. KMM 6896]